MPEPTSEPAGLRPLRAWPAALCLLLLAATHFAPRFLPEDPNVWVVAGFGPVVASLLLLLWWVFASRATRRERWLGALVLVAALPLSSALSDPTVRGPVGFLVTVPLGFSAFGLVALLVSRWRTRARTVAAVLAGALGLLSTTLVRNDGLGGDLAFELHPRWRPSHEERLLAEEAAAPPHAAPDEPFDLAHPEWPGFRGPGRDARVRGVALAADWEATPPEPVWKTRIGPGWSSFAVAGRHLFTQEQRGPGEATVCLDAESGERVWVREVEARFDDPLGGPGPRATPTLADGALYALGARGDLARLEPRTGAVVWSVDVAEVAQREPPPWGFASSPLVVDGLVIVHAGGADALGTLAFRAADGSLAWSAPAGDHAYSSPQLHHLLGEDVVLVLTNAGLDVLDPATGTVRLAYAWPFNNYRALQPSRLGEDGVLLPGGPGSGVRRLRLSAGSDGAWAAEVLWTSRFLKPDFNDLVVSGDHAFGFDVSTLACIDLATGERVWKEGRYGKGQVLLVQDSGHLLVTTEDGAVVLVDADPTEPRERGRFQALEGRSWAHPVLVGDRLYLRNSQEAGCWRLPLAPGPGRAGS